MSCNKIKSQQEGFLISIFNSDVMFSCLCCAGKHDIQSIISKRLKAEKNQNKFFTRRSNLTKEY